MRYISRFFTNLSLFIFGTFALSIFFKCILFHYICFNYVAVSSLWTATNEFFAFYFAKLFPAIFIASFVFLTTRYKWTIIVSIIIDLYLIANIIYFRANDLFLNFETIAMVSNLNGFWSAIITYFNWKIFLIPIVTGSYSFIIIKKDAPSNRYWLNFGICHLCVILLLVYDFALGYGCKKNKVFLSDFDMMQAALLIAKGQSPEDNLARKSWIECGTVFHYFPASLLYYIAKPYYSKDYTKDTSFSLTEKQILAQLVKQDSSIVQTSNNLIVILVESLESWPLFLKDENETEITPSLNELSRNNKVLFCERIKSQVKYGTSGDGQMIINTGLLPIQSGTACMLYGENTYPNFAHWYDGFVINPAPNTWNQPVVSISYGYQETIIPEKHNGTADDAVINEMTKKQLEKCKNNKFCIQEITASSHAPFTHVKTTSLKFPQDMPEVLQNYLQSIYYADSCIGDFLNIIERDSLFDYTTIVITGDHTIFKKSMLGEFQSFAQKYSNYPIPSAESYCPLIIYSPTIKERTVVDELCYQMDIFPTILHCIGADDYYWKGFGVNLLDSAARHNRKITEDEAYILSDKMIRSDYFRGIGE